MLQTYSLYAVLVCVPSFLLGLYYELKLNRLDRSHQNALENVETDTWHKAFQAGYSSGYDEGKRRGFLDRLSRPNS